MITDIRLSVNFPTHPKTLKLNRKLKDHPAASWLLVQLWVYVAQQRPDGVLHGMDAEDIEVVAGWTGEDGRFVQALLEVGYLDVLDDGCLACHDWMIHNAWVAGSEDRSDIARMSRLAQIAPRVCSLLRDAGIKSISKNDYEAIKKAASAGKSTADIIDSLTIIDERLTNAVKGLAPAPAPIPSLKPKTSTAAASSQASTTPTPSPPVEQQQQPGNVVTVFADSGQRIRSAFKERLEFLHEQFPHLNLAVEEEQCVAKYRDKPIATDAAVLVLEWCKRVSVGRQPGARSRDRPSRHEESVQRGLDNLAVAMEAIYAAEGV